jgi:hypothetical protein
MKGNCVQVELQINEKLVRRAGQFSVESGHTSQTGKDILMNLRCIYCQTPFTLARAEMLNAIVTMNEKHQNHYDAHCPRCRRANSISRQRMELFFPNWQDAAKQLASAPPPPASKVETPATAQIKTEPLPKVKKEIAKVKPAEKKSAERAVKLPPKGKKPAAAKAPAAKKPAVASPKGKKPAAKTTGSKPKKK